MDECPIVAVASSARDLEAIVELLASVPEDCDEAFVIVQHIDPARRGISLDEALGKRTTLPILVAQDSAVPKGGHIYVMSANTTVTINAGRIGVSRGSPGPDGPGNTLFTSLAEDRGDGAIGIVLSGAGSDGAIGVRAIKKAGGTTYAQFPGSARFPSMPISAIETGCVGSVLRPYEIVRELIFRNRLARHPEVVPLRLPLISAAVAG